MTQISLNDVSITFPIFNATSRSFTSQLLRSATGGILDSEAGRQIQVHSLQNITFNIREGEKVGLIGNNGSGKSTLLRALSGVYKPITGSIFTSGTIGSLIDISLGINPEASGRENIFLRGRLLGISKQELEVRFEEIVNFAELGDYIELPVRTYSTGMHLRLAFAVSTIFQPDILLMDEWLSVGDEHFVNKAENRLSEIVDSTKIFIIASHSRELLLKTCNRVIWLEHGKIKMDGPTEFVLASYFENDL